MGREFPTLPAEIKVYKVQKPAKAQLILPFNRDVFGNEEEPENFFTESVNSIRHKQPNYSRSNNTIIKEDHEEA